MGNRTSGKDHTSAHSLGRTKGLCDSESNPQDIGPDLTLTMRHAGDGTETEVTVKQGSPISELKLQTEEREHITFGRQQILLGDTELDENNSWMSAGVEDGACLVLVARDMHQFVTTQIERCSDTPSMHPFQFGFLPVLTVLRQEALHNMEMATLALDALLHNLSWVLPLMSTASQHHVEGPDILDDFAESCSAVMKQWPADAGVQCAVCEILSSMWHVAAEHRQGVNTFGYHTLALRKAIMKIFEPIKAAVEGGIIDIGQIGVLAEEQFSRPSKGDVIMFDGHDCTVQYISERKEVMDLKAPSGKKYYSVPCSILSIHRFRSKFLNPNHYTSM